MIFAAELKAGELLASRIASVANVRLPPKADIGEFVQDGRPSLFDGRAPSGIEALNGLTWTLSSCLIRGVRRVMTMFEGEFIATVQRIVSGLVVAGLVAVGASAAQPEALPVDQFLDLKVHSRALEHNLLGDSADQHVLVFLPRNYNSSPNKRYPVV